MKVLLDFGADPLRQPSSEHPPLAEYMYENAPHERFTMALDQLENSPNRAKKNIEAQQALRMLEGYNEIMDRIGGPAYRKPNGQTSLSVKADNPSATSSTAQQTPKTRLPVTSKPGLLAFTNTSFEAPRTDQYTFGVAGWQGARHGVVHPPTVMFPKALVPAGRQIAFLSKAGSWIGQTLPLRAAPEWRYTVQVYAGIRMENGFDPGDFELVLKLGDEVVAAQRFKTPSKGEFEAVTLSYDTGTTPPDGSLGVVLRNSDTRQVNFDLLKVYGFPLASGNQPPALTWENAPAPPQAVVSSPAPVTTVPEEPDTPPTPEWETVGFWDYDAVDGQAIPGGLKLVERSGQGLGKNWTRHLELKTHNQLRNRQRTLWPVELNRDERRVCVNYPNYPSCPAHVEFSGNKHDGIYAVGPCSGD